MRRDPRNSLNHSFCRTALQIGLLVLLMAGVAAGQDLVVTAFSASSGGTVGGDLASTSMTVRNQGTASAGPFRVGFYYSASSTFSFASAVFSGTYCNISAGLAAGISTTCGGAISIPSILSAGTYYLFAVADYLVQVTESDESNNARSADTGTVLLTGSCNVLPISLGQTVSGTLTTSSCMAMTDATAYAQLYRLTITSTSTVTIDEASTAFDSFLAVFDSASNLLAMDDDSGGSLNSRITRSFSPGTYYIEASTLIGGRTGAFTVSASGGASPLPDLAVTSFTAPNSGTIGASLSPTAVTVRNQGTAIAGPFIRVGFYWSASPTFSLATALYSGSNCTSSTSLAASTNYTCTPTILIPSSLSQGTYYLFAVVDDLTQVNESDENNNTRPSDSGTVSLVALPSTGADLVVTSLTAPTTGTIGGTLSSVAATVRNQGTAGAGAFRLGYYFSTSATFSFSSAVFSTWSCTFTGLAAASNANCTGNIGVPSSLAPGFYYLFAVADDLGQVGESNENNNSRAADTGRVNFPQPALSFDYIKTGVTYHVVSGQTVTFPNTIERTSKKVQFWVTNVSGVAATVSSITVTGTGFSLASLPTLPRTLSASSPGVQLNFDVVFSPTSPGTYTGTLWIDGSSFPLSAVAVADPLSFDYLSSGASPSIHVRPGETISLPNAPIGGSGTKDVTWITNVSGAATSIQSITISGTGFSLERLPSLPLNLSAASPGAQVNFDVVFKPSVLGTHTGTLTVDDRVFPLTGIGTQPPPALTISGLTDPVLPAQQPSFTLQVSPAQSVALTGTLTLTFASDPLRYPADDPNIKFTGATGTGRSLSFTIPANATSIPVSLSSTGTVAGAITVTATGQFTSTPRTVRVAQQAPALSNVRIINRTSTGFDVEVTGYSTTRELTQAVFTFTGTNLQTSNFTVPLTTDANTWFAGPSSTPYGGQFKYTQTFQVTQGNPANVTSVSVTVANVSGTSQARSGT